MPVIDPSNTATSNEDLQAIKDKANRILGVIDSLLSMAIITDETDQVLFDTPAVNMFMPATPDGFNQDSNLLIEDPLQESIETPVDIGSLQNRINSLESSVNANKEMVNKAQTTASIAQDTAQQSRSIAMRALSKANAPCSCQPTNRSVADSETETPDYVKG